MIVATSFWDGVTGFYDNLWDKTKNFFVNDIYHNGIETIWNNKLQPAWNGIKTASTYISMFLEIILPYLPPPYNIIVALLWGMTGLIGLT